MSARFTNSHFSCLNISKQKRYTASATKYTGNFVYVTKTEVDHSDRTVWSMNCIRPLEHWARGFESHSRYGYLCPLILCLCCPVCR
jgi:hypothetical protein